jgi:hypothetical protein
VKTADVVKNFGASDRGRTGNVQFCFGKHFNEIQRLATETARPFIFGISDKGSFDRLD